MIVEVFREIGLDVKVGFKVLGRSLACRVYVVSDDFDAWRYAERQEAVWRLVNATLTASEKNRISMIVTATREEVEDDEESPVSKPRKREVSRNRR